MEINTTRCIMNRIIKRLAAFVLISLFTFIASFAQEDYTRYIDPTIGNVVPLLVPTYPTMHLPNQMIRMFPVKQDYLSDQVDAFPLQVVSHRSAGILQMRVTIGEIKNSSWKQKMNIDHDLEVVHPWLYSTYLIDENIRVSFTPGEKCAIYRIDFPDADKKNLLIKGTDKMTSAFNGGIFTFVEKVDETSRGVNPETTEVSVYIYGELRNSENSLIKDAEIKIENGKFVVSFSKTDPATVLFRYAVSYISSEQAKINFEKELKNTSFDGLAASGEKAWGKVINQIEVKGGTEAQRRAFYTSLYRTY